MSATHSSIIRKLRNAQHWLSADGSDWDTLHDIILVCESLLDQSCQSYSDWWKRNGDGIAALKRKALAALVELTISDCDVAPNVYQSHPLLERFAHGPLVIETKRSRTRVCESCGKKFESARKRRFCKKSCKQKSYRRALRLGGDFVKNVSKVDRGQNRSETRVNPEEFDGVFA